MVAMQHFGGVSDFWITCTESLGLLLGPGSCDVAFKDQRNDGHLKYTSLSKTFTYSETLFRRTKTFAGVPLMCSHKLSLCPKRSI
jgi:hypothetical protein